MKQWYFVTMHILLSFSQIFLFVDLFAVSESRQRFASNGEPKNTTAVMGRTLTLKCQILNAAGSVQWFRESIGLGWQRTIPGYSRYSMTGNISLGEYNLLITDISPEDEATYECQASAVFNNPSIRSDKAHITVIVKPDDPVVQNGKHVIDIIKDSSLNLTCEIVGGRYMNITWYSSRDPIRRESTYVSINKRGNVQDYMAYYTLKARNSDNGATYFCDVIYGSTAETKKAFVKINVIYKPWITLTSNVHGTMTEGDCLELSCEAIANPEYISYRWYLDSLPLNGNSNILKVYGVTWKYHDKNITCTATNKVGKSNKTHKVQVFFKPRIEKPQKHVSIEPGDTVILNCSTKGNPIPSISWFKGESDKPISFEPILEISNASRKDLGLYICKAASSKFRYAKENFYLFEKAKPFLSSTPTKQYAKVGSDGKVGCIVKSLPNLENILWKFKGAYINYRNHERFDILNIDTPFGTDSYLEISEIDEKDFGEYTCIVNNDLGTALIKIELLEKDDAIWLLILFGIATGILLILLIYLILTYYLCRERLFSSQRSPKSNQRGSSNIRIYDHQKENNNDGDTSMVFDDFRKRLLENKSNTLTAQPIRNVESINNMEYPLNCQSNTMGARSRDASKINVVAPIPIKTPEYNLEKYLLMRSASANDISNANRTASTHKFHILRPSLYISERGTNV